MLPYVPLVVAANLVTLAFGAVVVRLAYRAHVRTGAGSLRALAVGLACVVAGAGVGLVLVVVPATGAIHAIAAQSVLVAAGVLALARSLDARAGESTQNRTIRMSK